MKQDQNKHHYCPVFYLKSWTTDINLFCGKIIKHTGALDWTPHAPAGTGFERGLYGEMEEKYFKPLDNKASKLLYSFLSTSTDIPIKKDLEIEEHKIWAEFLAMQIIRVPKNVKEICNSFIEAGATIEESKKHLLTVISEKVINDIRSMQWVFASIDTNLELITCDNPLILTEKNILSKNCSIIIPISPKHFFIATHSENLHNLETDKKKMVKYINKLIIQNSVDRIYALRQDSIKDSFIKKCLNERELNKSVI